MRLPFVSRKRFNNLSDQYTELLFHMRCETRKSGIDIAAEKIKTSLWKKKAEIYKTAYESCNNILNDDQRRIIAPTLKDLDL